MEGADIVVLWKVVVEDELSISNRRRLEEIKMVFHLSFPPLTVGPDVGPAATHTSPKPTHPTLKYSM